MVAAPGFPDTDSVPSKHDEEVVSILGPAALGHHPLHFSSDVVASEGNVVRIGIRSVNHPVIERDAVHWSDPGAVRILRDDVVIGRVTEVRDESPHQEFVLRVAGVLVVGVALRQPEDLVNDELVDDGTVLVVVREVVPACERSHWGDVHADDNANNGKGHPKRVMPLRTFGPQAPVTATGENNWRSRG